MILTNTAKSAFQWCHRRYYFQYRRGLVPIGVRFHLDVGRLFHEGLAQLMSGAGVGEVLDQFMVVDYPDEMHDVVLYVRFLLERYWKRYRPNIMQWHKLVAIEHALHIECESNAAEHLHLAGILDMIICDKAEKLWIVEHKTASGIDMKYLEKVKLDGQITFYLYLAWKHYNEIPAGVIYNVVSKPRIYRRSGEDLVAYLQRAAVEYERVPTKFFAQQPAFRAIEAFPTFTAEMRMIQEEIERCSVTGVWPKSDAHCFIRGRKCEYTDLCTDGETVSTLGKFKVVEPHEELRAKGLEIDWGRGCFKEGKGT